MAVQDIRVGGLSRTPAISTRYCPTTWRHCAMGTENPQKTGDIAGTGGRELDQQDNGTEMNLVYDRDTMARWESTCRPPTVC